MTHSKECCSHPDSKHYHQPCSCDTNWKEQYLFDTFKGETKDELVNAVEKLLQKTKEETRRQTAEEVIEYIFRTPIGYPNGYERGTVYYWPKENIKELREKFNIK